MTATDFKEVLSNGRRLPAFFSSTIDFCVARRTESLLFCVVQGAVLSAPILA